MDSSGSPHRTQQQNSNNAHQRPSLSQNGIPTQHHQNHNFTAVANHSSSGIQHGLNPSTFPRPNDTQRNVQTNASSWPVPNPLGPSFAQQRQPTALASVPSTTTNTSTTASGKPKVALSPQAKQALAKAIWSAIRSPTGNIAPDLMQAALKTGLPQHAILNAAKVAREKEALKANKQPYNSNPLQQPSTNNHQPQHSQMQAKEMQAKLQERSMWKRTQHGLFMNQKDRFVAVPFSVGPITRSTDTDPTLQPSTQQVPEKMQLLREAQLLQANLNRTYHESLMEPDRCKRHKMEAKKFANGLARAARKARQNVADSMSKQHKELAKSISSHQQEFFRFHRQRKAELAKLAKAVRDSFDKEEKKKEKDAVQAERARLAALKANDMTAYSKLLEETKNDRLKFLLDKTEEHFTQISSLLQERSLAEGNARAKPGSSYYASAHMKTEEVRQPSMLIGGDLKEYQLTGLQWLVSLYNNNLNGILADEMGLGKTIQAISLVAYLMEFKQNLGPYLIIVPLSTLSNWQNEFAKWCPTARVVCYKGTPGIRKQIYRDQISTGHFNVLLTTYEYIIKDKKFLRKIEWQYAIVDEGHRMKNAQSKFAVTLGSLYTTKYRILLTGTPLMNDLSELWALLNFLLPSIFNSVETFDQWFSRPFAQFGSGNAEDENDQFLSNEERILIIHRLHELLRPFMLRRVKSEVLDQLPEKVEKVLRCELSSWQKELYKQISAKAASETSLMGEQQPKTPSRGLNNVVMQLRKVCNHPYLFSPEGYRIDDKLIRSSGKFALLDQMLPKLRAAGHRVLMFTQMTQVMTILEDYFIYRGYLSLRLDGSTPAEEREKRMYKFNAPDSPYFIFLLSTRAGGLGLNLTSASTVIIFDSDWNPMMDLQAQDRAHRIGQRSDVSVFRLVTYSPVEEKILSRATEKLNVSELVVESGQFNKQSIDSDNSLERKRLMEVLLTDFSQQQPKPQSEAGTGSEGDDENDDGSEGEKETEDLNELLSNNEVDFELYASLDHDTARYQPVAVDLDEAVVPEWITNPTSNRQGAGNGYAFETSDGARKRKSVAYDDGLTEKQFLRMMDKQIVEEEQSRKRFKTEKAVTSAKASEIPEDVPASVGTSLTDWTFRKLISCSKSVVALKDPSTKRRLSDLFLEKPDPGTFPDYYEIIEKPMAINDILRKCRSKLYANLAEFQEDWKLMFANARKFNGEDSWVVEDAKALERELQRVLKKNGFSDDSVPTSKKTAGTSKLRIKLSLKGLKKE